MGTDGGDGADAEAAARRAARLAALQQVEAYLDKGLQDGSLEPDVVYKSRVTLARDYVLDLQMVVRATELLGSCDILYFGADGAQRRHMAEDPEYARAVVDLTSALVRLGLVDIDPLLGFPQAPGEA